MRRPPYVVPSRHDRLVATATRAIGGPVGRYATIGTRGLGAVAAALITLGTVMLALGVFQKGHCVSKGWSNPSQFWRACYSDIPVVHVTTDLADRSLPYAGTSSDQPLGSGLVMWLISLITPQAGTDVGAQRWVFLTWAAMAVLLLAAGVLAGIALLPQDPWHIAHLAASPVLVVLALISTDLVGIALVLWGWWAWTRSHPVVAGALMGVAFLVRPYPLIFLLAIALVAWREERVRAAVTALVSAALGALAIYLPALFLVGEGILAAPRGWFSSGAGYGALALLPQSFGFTVTASTLTVIALLGWLAALLVGAWLTFRSLARPDAARVAAVMLLIVALSAKSLSVQTGLWLLPLIALSAVRWRDHLIWAAVEIVHFEATWLRIGFSSDAGKGLPSETYGLAILLRMTGWAWVVWQIWDSPSRHWPERAIAPVERTGDPTPTRSESPAVDQVVR